MASTSAAKQSSAMKQFPNWLEMPHELMANIFQRLRTAEILISVRKVCTTWRQICKDPALWKVIDMVTVFDRDADHSIEMLTKQAVDFSCGELIDIGINGFGSDDLLDYIVRRSKNLNRLCLINCRDITSRGLSRAIERVPQLEQLYLSHISINAEDIEVIGRSCPQLKSFKMGKLFRFSRIQCDKNALAIANSMPELRHLQVSGSKMTNTGLEAILNGCSHLQSLDVRKCCYIGLEGRFGQLCMKRIEDLKCDIRQCSRRDYQTRGYDFVDLNVSVYDD